MTSITPQPWGSQIGPFTPTPCPVTPLLPAVRFQKARHTLEMSKSSCTGGSGHGPM